MAETVAARVTGPEVGALQDTRRWLIVVASGIVTVFGVIAALSVWSTLSSLERALALIGIAVVVVGIVLSRRVTGLWLVVAGLATTAVASLAPQGSPPWLPLTVLASYAVFFSVLLLPIRVAAFVPVVGAVAVAAVWSTRPGNVIAGPLGVLGGWVAVLQIVISGLATWWAWRLLSAEATVADDALAVLESQTAQSLAVQERARIWRATATRVHESLLNTIRYVLSTPTPDRTRLSLEVQLDVDAADGGQAPVPTVGRLLEAIRADALVDRVDIVRPETDAALEPAVFERIRAAAVELVRNADRHAGASRITVRASALADGRLTLSVADDGVGFPDDARPGVGLQRVLDESLQDIGATVSLARAENRGTVATITGPRVRTGTDRRSRPRAYPPFDKGRLLVTAPMGGICVAGVIYFLLLASGRRPGEIVAAIAGLAAIAVAVTVVVRRRRLATWPTLLIVLVPALVPWLLLVDDATCQQAAVIAPVVNISGFCIMILAAWSRWIPGTVGLAVWAVSSIQLLVRLPPTCRSSTALAVGNSLIALPLILAVASAGARAYQRAQDRGQLARQREIMERSRALAAIDINTQLEEAVHEAVGILEEVVAGAPLDDQRRQRLERVDGRIRAGIQVDPQSTGAVAALAKSTVDEVSSLGVILNVRSLASSSDPRPLPLMAQHLLYRLLATPSTPPAVIQAFTDGQEDHLSVVVGHAAIRDAGLHPGDTVHLDDVVVEVDDESGADDASQEYAVLVSRPIRVDRQVGHLSTDTVPR